MYTSDLNQSRYDASIVCDIVKNARKGNLKHNVTGVLIFDGHTFTQYIEGHENDVDRLIQNILSEERHKSVFVISEGTIENRLYEKWELGFIDLTSQPVNSDGVIAKSDLNPAAFHRLIDRFVIA